MVMCAIQAFENDIGGPLPSFHEHQLARRYEVAGFWGWNLLSKRDVGCLPDLADR